MGEGNAAMAGGNILPDAPAVCRPHRTPARCLDFHKRRIAWRDPQGVHYYFSDPTGSTRVVTDSSGSVCFDADYYPYGQEIDFTNSCSPTYKFAGYEYDSETGNYYAYARYYDPRLGRFLSPDPLDGAIGNPQSLNRYSYVLNNPESLTDPSGACTRESDISVRIFGGGGFTMNYGPAPVYAPGACAPPPPPAPQYNWQGVYEGSDAAFMAEVQSIDNGGWGTQGPVELGGSSAGTGGGPPTARQYILAIAAELAPLNELSSCVGQAVANQVPFGSKILGTPVAPADPIGSTLNVADKLSSNKYPGVIVWGLSKLGLPALSEAVENGVTKVVSLLSPYAEAISTAGIVWAGYKTVKDTTTCYDKPSE